MATIVPVNPIVSSPLSTLSYSAFSFGDLFPHDQIVERSATGVTDVKSVLPELYAIDDGLNYISDTINVYDYTGDLADFNTNVTIGGGSAPVDPTKGIQYWG